jgi:hypothetical protein
VFNKTGVAAKERARTLSDIFGSWSGLIPQRRKLASLAFMNAPPGPNTAPASSRVVKDMGVQLKGIGLGESEGDAPLSGNLPLQAHSQESWDEVRVGEAVRVALGSAGTRRLLSSSHRRRDKGAESPKAAATELKLQVCLHVRVL